jgi:hypothetical protein
MLKFDTKGFLQPSTVIKSSIYELKYYFVDSINSKTRNENYEKYIHYSSELKKVVKQETLNQWIDGSFVTKIKNPKDIDLVTFIDFETRIKYSNQLVKFEAKGANEIFGVDAYIVTIFPEKHRNHFYFLSDKAYWMERFSKSRRDKNGMKHPKGFLEIIF